MSTYTSRDVAHKLDKSINTKSKSCDQVQQGEAPIRFRTFHIQFQKNDKTWSQEFVMIILMRKRIHFFFLWKDLWVRTIVELKERRLHSINWANVSNKSFLSEWYCGPENDSKPEMY